MHTQLVGLDSQVVLDPTFCFPRSQWEKMANYPLSKQQKYILSFQIINRDVHYDAMLDYLHRKLGYEVIELKDSFRYKAMEVAHLCQSWPERVFRFDKECRNGGDQFFPRNSFFHSFPQIVFCSRNSFGFNSRMENLTGGLGLADRMFDSSTFLHSISDTDVVYEKVDEILKQKISATKQIIEKTFAK